MGQDIREMFKNEDSQEKGKLIKGHQKRFEARLEKELPSSASGNKYLFWKIAAVLVVIFGVGFFFLNSSGNQIDSNQVVDTPVQEQSADEIPEERFQLSDISPEFKKIENYYLAGINMELAKLEINNDNKALIDAFMLELQELDKEYQRLNVELNETGPNEQSIEAMVSNLQLRLELLRKLKIKLNELKNTKKNNYENLQA